MRTSRVALAIAAVWTVALALIGGASYGQEGQAPHCTRQAGQAREVSA